MGIRGSRAALALALWFTSVAAFAAGPGAVRKQVEASMVVTGTIQIDTAGKVSSYALDRQEKLPAGVVGLIDQAVPHWTFQPVLIDGEAAHVRTDMSIRVVASKVDPDSYSFAIRSAGFGANSGKPTERMRSVGLTPPRYPDLAARAGVTGTVYLLVKAGRDGKVIDVVAEQINLRVIDDERSMERWRRLFANAAVSKARGWRFTPPTEGAEAAKASWVLRVPVAFTLNGPVHADYGRWESYVPGPRLPNPWGGDAQGRAFNPDILPPGGTYLAGSGPVLLTDLADG
jgi:hypothetical protein